VAEAVLTVLQEVLPRYLVIPIVIQLPESAVQDVEVLVREVLRDLIYVLLLVDLLKDGKEVGLAYLS